MKESFEGVSIFNIVIVFVLLFAAYVSLMINYNKAFIVKNEVLSIINMNNGIGSDFEHQIADYFDNVNIYSTGNCKKLGKNLDNSTDWYTIGKDGKITSDPIGTICIKPIKMDNNESELTNVMYYKVAVFYNVNLPILSKFFHFSVQGESTKIMNSSECSSTPSLSWCF